MNCIHYISDFNIFWQILVTYRVASFAKFREMQKMILRKKFREKCVQKFAKVAIADFDPFWAKIGTMKSSS